VVVLPHHAFLPHLLLAMGFKPKPDWYLDPLPERNAVKAGVRDPAPWAVNGWHPEDGGRGPDGAGRWEVRREAEAKWRERGQP